MSLKPLTGLISDVVVTLPADDVQNTSGLALDIGSTIGKIIYRSNKEYKNGLPLNPQDDVTKGQVHFAMFSRSDVKGMVTYIKDNCDLKANEAGIITVNSAGVGGAAFKTDIEGGLNCKLEIISEFDCFCKAFLALEKVLPEDELLIPPSPEVLAEAEAFRAKIVAMMAKAEGMAEMKMLEKSEEVKEEDRPRMLVMAGSGSGIMQINTDGTFSMLGGLYTAGRFMYGLSTILTGENDFSKLEKMASESDGKTSDLWYSDLIKGQTPKAEAKGDEEENMYELMGDTDMHLFPFGKGVTVPAAEMKKGDLVWSVFSATASSHVNMTLAYARYNKAKAVYYCGNTVNTQLMRDLITKQTSKDSVVLPPDQQFECHFLKNGGMYGAMGAFLHVNKIENTHL